MSALAKSSLVIALLVLAAGAVWYWYSQQNGAAPGEISSFDECVAAGNPVMESYPEQCRTPGGETFVRDVTNDEYGGEEAVFCTQEARECPDGSYVGRTGPNCEFAACPP